MTIAEIEERVLQSVRDHWKGANVSDVQISDRLPRFFRGTLYFVAIYDANKKEHENLVYVVGKELWRYDDLKTLGANLGKTPSLADTLHEMFQFAGISGVIGIIITATICYIAVARPELAGRAETKIPEVLKGALTVILGFYFGRSGGRIPPRDSSPRQD